MTIHPTRDTLEAEIRKLIDFPVELAAVPLDRLVIIHDALHRGEPQHRFAEELRRHPHPGPVHG
jgi:hypothetical protein